jgi:predicted RNase H-like HicB family nuclease
VRLRDALALVALIVGVSLCVSALFGSQSYAIRLRWIAAWSAVGATGIALLVTGGGLQAPRNWAAYVPDLPGCVATGSSRAEVARLIREGIRLHLEAMRESGEPIPEPTTGVEVVEIA